MASWGPSLWRCSGGALPLVPHFVINRDLFSLLFWKKISQQGVCRLHLKSSKIEKGLSSSPISSKIGNLRWSPSTSPSLLPGRLPPSIGLHWTSTTLFLPSTPLSLFPTLFAMSGCALLVSTGLFPLFSSPLLPPSCFLSLPLSFPFSRSPSPSPLYYVCVSQAWNSMRVYRTMLPETNLGPDTVTTILVLNICFFSMSNS